MKYLSVLALIAVPLAASAATVSILTTPEYDVRTQSLDGSKCSGYLSSKGYKTLADIPQYPNVASSTLVEGSSSSYCGACFRFKHDGETVYVTVIDAFTLLDDPGLPANAKEVFGSGTAVTDILTNGELGPDESFQASAVHVSSSYCD